MKSLVIVSIPGKVFSLQLSDFPAGAPVEGRTYEFDGKLYKVTQVVETLGVRGAHGARLNNDMRLFSFAETVSDGDEVLKTQILKPTKIGQDGPEDVRSPGGLIISTTDEPKLELGLAYDHLMFVRAVPPEDVVVRAPSSRLPRALRIVDTVVGEDPEGGGVGEALVALESDGSAVQ